MVARSRETVAVSSPPVGTPASFGEGREQVSEIQRARLLSGMVDVVAELGVANASVAHVVARSGVSRRTFYEFFGDRQDCFLAAFDEAAERASGYMTAAYNPDAAWPDRIRDCLVALLELFDDQPEIACLLVVESLAAGPRVRERRGLVLAQLMSAVDAGRGESNANRYIPPLTAEGVVGAVSSVIHARLSERRPSGRKPKPLVGLTASLMGIVVLPYLGSAAARAEIERPVPKRPGKRPHSVGGDPLRDLQMRLTYRTVRVLVAVESRPGSSNRALGDASGMSDQGQISKLLARLERLGLIENEGVGPTRGEPNAWRLTARGVQVEHSIRSRTHDYGKAA